MSSNKANKKIDTLSDHALKAKSLVLSFLIIDGVIFDVAKKCAHIAVGEIISFLEQVPVKGSFFAKEGDFAIDPEFDWLEYYKEVKTEIEKL